MLFHEETYCFRTRFGNIHVLSTTVLNILRFGLVLPWLGCGSSIGGHPAQSRTFFWERDTPLQRSLLSICCMAPSRSSNVAGDSERTQGHGRHVSGQHKTFGDKALPLHHDPRERGASKWLLNRKTREPKSQRNQNQKNSKPQGVG